MWHVGTLLFVHFNETAFGNCHASFFRIAQFTVWRTTRCNQYQIIALWFGWGFFTFKCNVNAIFFSFNRNGFGFRHDVVKAMRVHFFPYFNQITVSTLHQTVHHFYHIQTCAQCAVNRTHLQTDDTTTDNQHFFRDLTQFQCTCTVHNTWVFWNKWQIHHTTTHCDDTVFESNGFFAACFGGLFVLGRFGQSHFNVVRSHKFTKTFD